MNSNSHKQHDGSGDSPSGESPDLDSFLLKLVDEFSEFFAACDPASYDAETEFGPAILGFLRGLKTRIEAEGEQSYMARKVGLFVLELMSLRTHGDRDPLEVPQEHAAILDAAIRKVASTRSGMTGDPDVDRLAQVEAMQKTWLKAVIQEAGLQVKVPLDQEPKKLIVN